MNNLANVLRKRKQRQFHIEAKQLLLTALEINPKFSAAWMNLGIVRTQLEEYRAAEDSYKNAITLRKDFYADAHFNLGTLHLKFQSKKNQALFEFNKAINQNENHFSAWSNKIILLDELDRLDDALESIEKANILFPDKAEFYFLRGNIFGKLGDYEKGEMNYKEAIKMLDKRPQSYSNHIQSLYRSNLGVLYHRWKKPENAMKQYEYALQYDPNNSNARENLKRLRK